MSATSKLANFLDAAGVTLTLVDIGSSGYRHKIWDPISSASQIIGFDPDSRHFDPDFERVFKGALLVSKAVTDNDDDDVVEFILTQYPSCSSVLAGDIESLEPFMFRDYFVEESRASVPATSLNRVIVEHEVNQLDWIKIDAQGFDLDLVKSLSEENLNSVIAFDLEPGFIDAYLEEALFPETHTFMKENGFWLSDLQYQAYPRATPKSWNNLLLLANEYDVNEQNVIRKFKGAPTAAEARYLRTIEHMEKHHPENPRAFIVLFAFALLDGHAAYCFDILESFQKLFGNGQQYSAMNELLLLEVRENLS